MQSAPWFSTQKKQAPYEHKETVHHDNSACAEGEQIIKKHLEFGTGGRPLCKKCAQLDAEERQS